MKRSHVPRIETPGRPHTKRDEIVLCGILYRLDTCDPALHVFCELFGPFDEHLDRMGCMARRVGHETLLVNNDACAVCTLAIFAVEYTGAGGGKVFCAAVESGEVVVHRSEKGECCDGNVYPEVAGHPGGGEGGGGGKEREGGLLITGMRKRLARDLAIHKYQCLKITFRVCFLACNSRGGHVPCAYRLHLGAKRNKCT